MKNMIETKNLTKTYKEFIAVDHVSLHIKKGSIYGFLGPNGAGKSTTMKMLLGLTAPTDGEFQIDNMTFPNDRVRILKEVGSFIESPSFYPNLTGRENLDIIRRILELPASSVDKALELVGLSEFGNRLAKKYSLGMKQRLGLASALLGEPPVLILDEPTSGLDPVARSEILDIFQDFIQNEDNSIFVSSHITSDLEHIADYITFINEGKIVLSKTRDELLEMYGIVKCSKSEFEKINKNDYVKFKVNRYEYDVLVEDKSKFKRKYDFKIIDKPTLDDIMLIYIKGEKSDENY